MGDFEASVLAGVESQYEIPLLNFAVSNPASVTRGGPCVAGSFGGALYSQKVTEESIKVL